MPKQIIIFKDKDFHGQHTHVFDQEANLRDGLNDAVSSFVILEGTWTFFRHFNFHVQIGQPLGPGKYRSVDVFGLENDQISSLKAA
jgi:hypothetical protein